MKHHRIILIFLLLGAILNVGVAWGCEIAFQCRNWRIDEDDIYDLDRAEAERLLLRYGDIMKVSGCIASYHGEVYHGYGVSLYIATAKGIRRGTWVRLSSAGWPFRSIFRDRNKDRYDRRLWKHPIKLPLRPIPLGFTLNSIFYGTILWILIRGLSILRRRRWIKNGQCERCGYVVWVNAGLPHASPHCTECGTPIPARIHAPGTAHP